MPPRASRLTRREREVVLSVVDALLAASDTRRNARSASDHAPTAVAYGSAERAAPAPREYDLVAYSSDGTGLISPADMETIRQHEEQRRK
ncbi:hypothetical protein [Streptomyces murinus]|uniref:hypothetical protein n=1 Tax=Streptomyces murinus TaxID=33900 RepID=UPI003F4621C8